MNEIREDSNGQDTRNASQGAASNQYIPLEDEREYIPEINQQGKNAGKKELSAFTKRIKKSAWIVFAVGIVSMIIYSMGATSKSVDTSEDAVSALETHMSSSLAAGTKLLAKCQTAHCGRGKSHFIFGGLASPIVPSDTISQMNPFFSLKSIMDFLMFICALPFLFL